MEQANIALVYALASLIGSITLCIVGWGVYVLVELIRDSKRWDELEKIFKPSLGNWDKK